VKSSLEDKADHAQVKNVERDWKTLKIDRKGIILLFGISLKAPKRSLPDKKW